MSEIKMLSITEAADRLGVTRQRVHAIIKSGNLAFTRVGNAYAVDESELERYQATRREAGRPKSTEDMMYALGRVYAIVEQALKEGCRLTQQDMDNAMTRPLAGLAGLMNKSSGNGEVSEQVIAELLDTVDAERLPAHASLTEQGKFIVGYYHQKKRLSDAHGLR